METMTKRVIGYMLGVVGAALILVAFKSAPAIPKRARSVYSKQMGQPDSVTGDKSWFTQHREWYYEAHLKRMYLQNAYVALTGLVLLVGGINCVASDKQTQDGKG
jgi:hypothetical protein